MATIGTMTSWLLCLVVIGMVYGWDADPVADPSAVIISPDGTVRITVLTDRLLRAEWSSKKNSFVDAQTIAVLNRKLPVPDFSYSTAGGVLRVTTSYLELNYNLNMGAFSSSNFWMTVYDVGGANVTYHYGDEPTGNLLGTLRTLDKTDGGRELYCPNLGEVGLHNTHCTLGVASRDGWAIVNDTDAAQFDGDSEWNWLARTPATITNCNVDIAKRVTCNPSDLGSHNETSCTDAGCCWHALEKTCSYPIDPTERLDIYLFGHAHSYKQAIYDLTLISGPIPMIPRYTYGVQYSRWFAYNEIDERMTIIKQGYQEHSIPLDVLVLDMDWHVLYHHHRTYCNPVFDPWTAFTWNTNLWNDPDRFISWASDNGLHLTLNNHPDRGVQCVEQKYVEMCDAMGLDPSTNDTVRYAPEEKVFSTNFFGIVLDPIRQQGISYWWVDYQQGEALVYPGVNPTIWVNYIFSTSPQWWSATDRGLLMARWGGIGNHRYRQIGFSGDVDTTWDSLAFQPYFTTSAANVGFSWSHDLGGFSGQPDGELYTRWVQWGLFSPVMRTHCDKHYYREIWLYSYDYFKIMREAMQLRSMLLPYIYSSAWKAYSTSVAIEHPVYYEWPEYAEAYTFQNEYLFGDNFIVNPITSAGDANQIATDEFWIPPGNWVEWYTGKLFVGPQTIIRQFLLSEVPVYARSGSIIPMKVLDKSDVIGRAPDTASQLRFLVFVAGTSPGEQTSFTLYDDDGLTSGYESGSYYTTLLNFQLSSWTTFSFTINPASGQGFSEMPTTRTYEITFMSILPASQVTVNGVAIPEGGTSTNQWNYDGTIRAVVVTLDSGISIKQTTVITVTLSGPTNQAFLLNDYQRKVHIAQMAKQSLDSMWGTYYPDDYPSLLQVAGTGNNIDSSNAASLLSAIEELYSDAIVEVNALSASDARSYCLDLLMIA